MWAFLLSWLLPFCLAATPDTIVRVEGLGDDLEWLARRGFFGSDKESVTGLLVHSPDDNEYMCNDTVGEIFAQDSSDIILLVPRGQCTYELKAYHAQELFGAKGILIYDHLAGRYGWNETTQRVRFPYYDRYNRDYECELGFGVAKNLDLDPPAYNGTVLDPLLDMTSFTTVCELNVTHTPCESQLCLVTSHKLNSTEYPVCCAWDLPQTMGGDDTVDAENIVAVFFTIRQGQEVLPYVGQVVTIQERPYSVFNISLVFMWLLGVLVTGIGSCWLPTEEYREFRARLAEFQQKRGQQQTKSAEDATSDDELSDDVLDRLAITLDDLEAESEEEEAEEDEDVEPQSKTKDKQNKLSPPPRNNQRKNDRNSHSLNSLPRFSQTQNDKDIVFSLNFTRTKTQNDNAWVLHSLPPPERKRGNSKTAGVPELSQVDHIPAASTSAPTTELTHWHVLSFVLISSLLLVLLFKFQFYSLVAVFYGFCCSGCVSYLIFGPILTRIIPKFGGDEVTKEFNKHIMCSCNGFDVTSQLIGLIWAILWIWYGLSHYQPSGNAFFWISLDIFGACFSLMGLYMMKLNDIRIATYLMVAIFFYDIFFVFITPLFTETGDSVMLTVAKGGASQESTDDFCVRYPDDRDCTGIDFLPMLLLIPRVNDIYQGNVLLGLGDIVLPGFLLAFCARVDEAARLVGKHTSAGIDFDVPEKWYQGYWFPLMIAYSLGLFLTFMSLVLTEKGQPALFYIVPLCLGTMLVLGRKHLKDLWRGAKQIRLADKLKRKCEKAWGQERMKRLVAKKKRERALEDEHEKQRGVRRIRSGESMASSIDASGNIDDHNNRQHRSSVGGRGGRGRGRGSGGRGRGRGRGPGRGSSGRSRGPSRVQGNGSRSQNDVADKSNTRETSSAKTNEETITKESPDEDDDSWPTVNDVCFGDKVHPGTKEFHKVVQNAAQSFADEEYGPVIYKSVKKQLKGKRFFNVDGQDASASEIKAEVKKAFNKEKMRR